MRIQAPFVLIRLSAQSLFVLIISLWHRNQQLLWRSYCNFLCKGSGAEVVNFTLLKTRGNLFCATVGFCSTALIDVFIFKILPSQWFKAAHQNHNKATHQKAHSIKQYNYKAAKIKPQTTNGKSCKTVPSYSRASPSLKAEQLNQIFMQSMKEYRRVQLNLWGKPFYQMDATVPKAGLLNKCLVHLRRYRHLSTACNEDCSVWKHISTMGEDSPCSPGMGSKGSSPTNSKIISWMQNQNLNL